MPRTSSTSNPTKLIDIDRKCVTIDLTRSGPDRYAALTRLDLVGYDLPPDLKLVMVARAGSTFCRTDLGTIERWNKSPVKLEGLDPRGFQRFRIFAHPVDSPQLVASAENLTARDLEQADSFLVMEPAELGDVVWELTWNSGEPVLLFNQDIFPNARGATSYAPFCAMVLPEVVRQVAMKIAKEPQRLEDDSDPLFPWSGLLARLGVDELPEPDDDKPARTDWVNGVVKAFAANSRLASALKGSLSNAD